MKNKLINEKLMKECQEWRPNIEKIKNLLEQGANINQKDIYGNTALNSIILRKPEIVKLFMDNGADIFTKNNDLLTPLHTAASYHDTLYSIHILVEKGLNINEMDKHQMTPLHCAALSGCLENVELLVSLGANTALLEIDGKTAQELARVYHKHDVAQYLLNHSIKKEKNNLIISLSNEIKINSNKLKL